MSRVGISYWAIPTNRESGVQMVPGKRSLPGLEVLDHRRHLNPVEYPQRWPCHICGPDCFRLGIWSVGDHTTWYAHWCYTDGVGIYGVGTFSHDNKQAHTLGGVLLPCSVDMLYSHSK